jgi:hypothetical protein
VEGGVFAQCGNIVEAKQQRGGKKGSANSKLVRNRRTSKATRRTPVVSVKKAVGSVKSEAPGGRARKPEANSSSNYVKMVAGGFRAACRNATPTLLGLVLVLALGRQPRLVTSWSSVHGIFRDLVHGVLIEQPCADEVEGGVFAQCGNIVEAKQQR